MPRLWLGSPSASDTTRIFCFMRVSRGARMNVWPAARLAATDAQQQRDVVLRHEVQVDAGVEAEQGHDVTLDRDASTARRIDAGDEAQKRRLAGAVGPGKADAGAGLGLDREIVDG